ncbi:hypothetical protein NE237_005327 [Protea cynaroides]|uniref:Uncharacterized protein n=1 Tax=Protea cynaroides TaxID=273540 RepID=A0A9Q0KKB2_9MAGN|nr:hypothetical protein NE237_005327 [Protea cynaroides]
MSLLHAAVRNNLHFSFGRQSSLDPQHRNSVPDGLAVPENLDSTMQLLFMASKGDDNGVEELINEGVNVNSNDLDGRTALHIAACDGQRWPWGGGGEPVGGV